MPTFPLVLGADVAGVVEAVGDGTSRYSPGDEVFGQLLISPLGSAGTYAEYVAVTQDAPLARVPSNLDATIAASLPTAGGAALDLVDALGPLAAKTVVIVGAAGTVGSFVTQLTAQAGAHVIATARQSEAARLRGYGAVETIDYAAVSLPDAISKAHPDGVDVLIDLASDAGAFAALASLVRSGGSALTVRYVADLDSLAARDVRGINFQLRTSTQLLERLAEAVVSGRLMSPGITTVALRDLPAWEKARGDHPNAKAVVIP
ncbi:MAG: NADP-dependent oxidoreductase [Solirubrobacteraceae bacterium]